MTFIRKNKLRLRLSSVHSFIYIGENNILKYQINNDLDLLKELNTNYAQLGHANWEESHSLLKEEFSNEMKGVKHVAILLSGGMDSRIAASLINDYSYDHKALKVTAYTWGAINSRDVIYSQKICKIFDWEFIHIELSDDDFMESIKLSINSKASISPIHFHGVSAICRHIKAHPVDKVIGASYGDSLGRGEYSGINIIHNKRLVDSTYSKWSPLYSPEEKAILNSGISKEFSNFNITNSSLIQEMTYQYCYMGMMLNPVFDCINNITPVYQIMTSNDFRYHILSHKRELRSDDFYLYILSKMSPELSKIPWARTGKVFGSSEENSKDNHGLIYYDYPNTLRNIITKKVFRNVENISFFNRIYYGLLLVFWKLLKTKRVTFYDEFFSTLYVFNESDKSRIIYNSDIKVSNVLIPFIYIFSVWCQEKINMFS